MELLVSYSRLGAFDLEIRVVFCSRMNVFLKSY